MKTVKIPDRMHQRIKRLAKRKGVTMLELGVEALNAGLDEMARTNPKLRGLDKAVRRR